MKIKKICEYLSEIGILEIKDINYFLKIYSQIEQNKCKREIDRLKITLFSYLNSISKNDNLLFSICRNIIDSYLKTQLVLKYKSLNSLSNIFKNKFRILYNSFISKLNLFILKKKKNKFIVQPVYYKTNKLEKNNNENKNTEETKNSIIQKRPKQFTIKDICNDPKDRITEDDVRECTFVPIINHYKPKNENFENSEKVKSYIYYSPSFNILAKMPANKNYKNNKFKINRINSLTNNDSINLSYLSGNLNNGNKKERYNTFNNSKNKRYKKDSFSSLDNYNISPQIKDNYFYDDNYIDNNNYLYRFNNEYISNRNNTKTPRGTKIIPNENFNKFLLEQDKHVKDVEKKVLNLKLEQRNKEEKECSFSPEIHYYKGLNKNNVYSQNLSNYYNNFPLYQSNIHSQSTTNFINNRNTNSVPNIQNNYNNYTHRSYGRGICPRFEGSLSPKEDKFTKEFYNIEKKQKRPHSVSQEFFDKLSNENIDKNKRIEELRKKIINYDFSPKIEYNKKYKIKDSFEQRQAKYIENKKILNNKKEEDEKMFVDEMNKMYMPKRKCKEKDIVDKLYNKEEVDKIKERNKKEEKDIKKKNIINWRKRFKEKKKNPKVNIYDFSKKNKLTDKKNNRIEININDNNNKNEYNKKNETIK